MPQLQLPIFPAESVPLSATVAVICRDRRVTYFHGSMPVFTHQSDDVRSFRMFISQLYVNGQVTQADVKRVFGVPAVSLKRAVKLYKDKGPGGFWQPRRGRGPSVLTEPVLREVQEALDNGEEPKDVATRLGLNQSTVSKATHDGRLHRGKKKPRLPSRS